jgi:DMSO reductase family type II enzyme heme b subunit
LSANRLKTTIVSLVALMLVVGIIFPIYRQGTDEFGRAPKIYQKQCASCHGGEGLGDGEAAYLLFPRPRDFSLGRFRLVTTEKGIPNDQDLFDAISYGMPGSAMPPWEHLSEKDRWDLVDYVRKLTFEGMVMRRSEGIHDDAGLAEITERVSTRLISDPSFELSEEMTASPEALKLGEDLYVKACAGCHGLTGHGDGNSNTRDEQGYMLAPNEFTRGIFKGSGSVRDIIYRIRLGMPGSAMPSFDFGNDEYLWAIAHYVRSFVPEFAEVRTVQHRQSVPVRKVKELPQNPIDPSWWLGIDATYIALMPLWMQNDKYIEGVFVRAAYDAENIFFYLSWPDTGENVRKEHSVDAFTDGAALQFSNEADPPFFAMGDAASPVNIWLWKADKVEDLNANGFGTLELQNNERQNMSAIGVWKNGVWHVVFARSIDSLDNSDVEFKVDRDMKIAFAVWDGDRQDRDGQKSITIWHDLELIDP